MMVEPRREQILQRIQTILEGINTGLVLDTCDDLNGWVVENNAKGWNPVLDTSNKVEGTAAIQLGIKQNKQLATWYRPLYSTYDFTDKVLDMWVYIYNKLKFHPPWITTAIRLFLADDLANIAIYNVYRDDLGDVLNDGTDGWNFINKYANLYDAAVGVPDLANINNIGIMVEIISGEVLPLGECNMDYWTVGSLAFFRDVLIVTRAKTSGFAHFSAFPAITFMVVAEDCESKIYPAMFNRMLIELAGYDRYAEEDVLDRNLGYMASDIQMALMKDQTLNGLAQYVEVKRWEITAMEGNKTGVLQGWIEVGYMVNQKDPTQGA